MPLPDSPVMSGVNEIHSCLGPTSGNNRAIHFCYVWGAHSGNRRAGLCQWYRIRCLSTAGPHGGPQRDKKLLAAV